MKWRLGQTVQIGYVINHNAVITNIVIGEDGGASGKYKGFDIISHDISTSKWAQPSWARPHSDMQTIID